MTTMQFRFDPKNPDSLIDAYEKIGVEYCAKDVLYVAESMKRSMDWKSALNCYYEALTQHRLGKPAEAMAAALKVAVLAGGVTQGARPEVRDGVTLIPAAFFAEFPGARELMDKIGTEQAALAGSYAPTFVLGSGKSVIQGLSGRVSFGEKYGRYDYWPASFSRREHRDGSATMLDRQGLAYALMEDMLAKYFPPGFAQRPRHHAVAAFGSCFAVNLAASLIKKEIACHSFRLDEVVNTPRANRLLLEYLLMGRESETDFFSRTIPLEQAESLRAMIGAVSVVVLTIGVAPVLEWRESGRFCIGTESYKKLIEEGRVVQRFTTVEENREHIVHIVELLRSFNPAIDIFLTLSPVPLFAVADGGSVISRDLLSKSTLRVAIEQAAQDCPFLYWPSFELVKWIAPHVENGLNYQAFGESDKNSRDVSRWLIDIITETFIERVFVPAKG